MDVIDVHGPGGLEVMASGDPLFVLFAITLIGLFAIVITMLRTNNRLTRSIDREVNNKPHGESRTLRDIVKATDEKLDAHINDPNAHTATDRPDEQVRRRAGV